MLHVLTPSAAWRWCLGAGTRPPTHLKNSGTPSARVTIVHGTGFLASGILGVFPSREGAPGTRLDPHGLEKGFEVRRRAAPSERFVAGTAPFLGIFVALSSSHFPSLGLSARCTPLLNPSRRSAGSNAKPRSGHPRRPWGRSIRTV